MAFYPDKCGVSLNPVRTPKMAYSPHRLNRVLAAFDGDVVLTAWKELKNTRKFSYHSPSQSPFRVQLAFSQLYSNNNSTMGPSFVVRPVLASNVVPPYQAVAQREPSSGYAGNGKRDNGYPPQPPPSGACYGARVMNGGGGYGAPLSPVSPYGLGTNENCGGQFGLEMGMLR